jgi:cytochrome P450
MDPSELCYPFPKPAPQVAPPQYERLRSESPVCPVTTVTGQTAFLITRHADVKRVLADASFSLAAAADPTAPSTGGPRQPPGTLLSLDPPAHTRLRRLVSAELGSRRIAALRPAVEALTAGYLDTIAASKGDLDLYTALAAPLPVAVLCRLFGAPIGDYARFQLWSSAALDTSAQEALFEAYQAMGEYFYRLIADRRSSLADDLFTALVRAVDSRELSERELIMLACTLMVAGSETTTSFLANGLVRLLEVPGHWQRLHDDPELIGPYVEELLRLEAHGPALTRIALRDVEIAGVRIPAGSAVIPAIDSANRDPAEFDAAEQICPERPGNPHLTFGFGPHFCVGAAIARIELQIAIGSLARRFPGLALAAPKDAIAWRTSLAGGPTSIPVHLFGR